MKQTGHCLCGAVRFQAEGVESHFHSCHCGTCRRWSGGPGMATQATDVHFDDTSHIRTYASSEWAERAFCDRCGTNLYYRMKEGGNYFMWIGAFDDASAFTMGGEIYIDAKPDGYAFAGDHPRVTEAQFLESIGMAPG
jgi:hypothetical protein